MGSRKVTRWALLCAGAVACGPTRNADAPAQSPSTSVARPLGAAAAPDPPVEFDPGSALALLPDEGEILVRTDVLRTHPVGARLGPLLGTWPGWRSTLRALAPDPFVDLDWIEVASPSDARQGRMLVRVAAGGADSAIDGRLVALQARSAEPAATHVAMGVSAAAARLDGALRVVFHAQPRFVAVTPAMRGVSLSRGMARARFRAPATAPFEALRADVPQPHALVRIVPETIRRMRAHVFALPDGDADASADGECASPEDAKHAAAALQEAIAHQNFALVRMLTHGLLDEVGVTVDGAIVKLHLRATREQLDAVVGLATAMIPSDGSP